MEIIIKPTPWDDAYFNLKTGRVTLADEMTPLDIQNLQTISKTFDLVVIDNSKCSMGNDHMLSKLKNSYLCDIQVRFKLKCNKVRSEKSSYIKISNHVKALQDILNISASSFQYSRFKVDPYLDSNKSQKVYLKWCQSAFDKSDKYFAVCEKEGSIEGYALFHIDKALVIELIAVEEKKQGEGIGSAIMNQLICYCQEKNIDEIRVGTQAENKNAVRFYQKKGFSLDEVHTIYHYWPNK